MLVDESQIDNLHRFEVHTHVEEAILLGSVREEDGLVRLDKLRLAEHRHHRGDLIGRPDARAFGLVGVDLGVASEIRGHAIVRPVLRREILPADPDRAVGVVQEVVSALSGIEDVAAGRSNLLLFLAELARVAADRAGERTVGGRDGRAQAAFHVETSRTRRVAVASAVHDRDGVAEVRVLAERMNAPVRRVGDGEAVFRDGLVHEAIAVLLFREGDPGHVGGASADRQVVVDLRLEVGLLDVELDVVDAAVRAGVRGARAGQAALFDAVVAGVGGEVRREDVVELVVHAQIEALDFEGVAGRSDLALVGRLLLDV